MKHVRVIVIELEGEDLAALVAAAELAADEAEAAALAAINTPGVTLVGTEVIDPDAEEEEEP
jgi:hypothetical protein